MLHGREIFFTALLYLVYFMQILLVIRAIMSWVPLFTGKGNGPLNQILISLTEPIIAPVRNLINRSQIAQSMPIDLSFIIAYIILQFVARFIARLI